MQLRRYRGPLIERGRTHPALARLLGRRDTLVELGAPAPRVVLGVPHHAPVGVPRIAERSASGGRVSDENAVLYALVCLEALAARAVPARLLVAAHATDHDPNKHADSAYCTHALAAPAAALLIECHGASRRAPHDLEISAGHNAHADPLRFGRLLARALGPGVRLAAQIRPGSRAALLLDAPHATGAACALRFPALRTQSLRSAAERGIAALHVEAKPHFRSRGDGSDAITAAGQRLGVALASAAAAALRLPAAAAGRAEASPSSPGERVEPDR